MADNTHIEWTDATWNVVTGCTKVSPGCDNCYIARTPPFRMAGRQFDKPGVGGTTGVMLHPDRLSIPGRWTRPRRIFVCSLADLFHDDVPQEYIAEVFAAMVASPRHSFQVLTKRPARMRSLLRSPNWRGSVAGYVRAKNPDQPLAEYDRLVEPFVVNGALPHIWIGVSAEDQQRAELRIPILLDTPAVVRWVSAEPLLGPVDLTKWVGDVDGGATVPRGGRVRGSEVGRPVDRRTGESVADRGATPRPMDVPDVSHPLRAAASRELGGEVPTGPGDVRLDAVSCDGSPAGLAALHGADSVGSHREPQERDLVRQSTGEPRAGDAIGAGQACAGSSPSRTTESVRDAELHGSAHLRAGGGDSGATRGRRATSDAGDRVRGAVPAHFEDRTGRASISWIVCGGESGPAAPGGPGVRPMHPDWARSLRDQCEAAGVAYLFKQWGDYGVLPATLPDGRYANDPGVTVANDGTVYQPGDLAWPDGPRVGEAIRAGHDKANLHAMYRVGKKAAGRELDGRTWDEYPTAREAVTAGA